MTGILIVTHGDLGAACLATAEMMLGPQEACVAMGLSPAMGSQDLAANVQAALARMGGDALVFVDMLGGTPWNVAAATCRSGCEVVSGVSLPLLLEALSQRGSLPVKELAAWIVAKAPESVAQASVLLKGRSAP